MSFEVLCGKRAFPFSGDTLFVGRSTACDIHLTGDRVSRKHARLKIESGGVVIEDLGSRNGVFVNGERIEGPHRIQDGDHVSVGGHELQVRPVEEIADPHSIDDDYDEDDLEFNVGAITVVDSQLAMVFEAAQTAAKSGNAAGAEAVLAPGLRAIHRAASEGDTISGDDLSYCVRGACLLARSQSKPEWVKFAVDVQLAAKESVTDEVAKDLYETAHQLDVTSELERVKLA